MRAAIYTEPSKMETRETPTPEIGPGDVLLKVRACGVCGTDVRKYVHHLVSPPTILGHEVAGEVVALGASVTKFELGDRVVVAHHTPCFACHYCRHGNVSMCRLFKKSNLDPGGFAEFLRIPKGHVEMTAFRIPETLSYDEAIFMEPLACVVRNLRRASLQPGDTVLVIGLGSMGLLTGQLARALSCRVIGTDLREDRRSLARNLGFDGVLDGNDPTLVADIHAFTESRGADLVVLTAGNKNVYSRALSLLRDGGALSIFAGLEPGEKIEFDANELYMREIVVYSSYSPAPSDLFEALEFLRSRKVLVDVLQPKRFALEELNEAMKSVIAQDVMKAIIAPQGV